ncbi:hypothetical protein NM208_g3348 [Fusarium decemcellulare]|uniref:Uncharacterized protein n=1 Tax=Fusarium decemcellulare TaxID=57161 RepID=A0ACC1SPQ9_9HYPO|nr:hypothetical protein NM208_g3348 [Fusarium decemcellulare]
MPPSGTEGRPDDESNSALCTKDQANAPERQVKGQGRPSKAHRTGDVDEQTTPSVESQEGSSRTSEAAGSSQSSNEQVINLTPHPLLKYLPKQDRNIQFREADKLYRVAKHLKLDFTDIYLDRESFLPTWDSRDDDLERLDAEGKLKRLVAEPTPQPPSKRARTGTAKASRFSERLTFLDPVIEKALESAIKDVPHQAREWHDLRSRRVIRGIRIPHSLLEAQDLFWSAEKLMADLKIALGPKNTRKRQWNLDAIIRLMLRASGLVELRDIDSLDYAAKWDSYKEGFEECGKEIGEAMNIIFALRNVKDGFEASLPMLRILRESALIKDQLKLCRQVELLLDDWAASL